MTEINSDGIFKALLGALGAAEGLDTDDALSAFALAMAARSRLCGSALTHSVCLRLALTGARRALKVTVEEGPEFEVGEVDFVPEIKRKDDQA